ncbi:MAG: hypothetical protein HN929_06670 [Chloroflexi bacterium]|jgi:inhibitor of cysteine peptidase|nr:hypothetical protein [Chloroflexota bacterium]MBT7081129.1 hypothetical protein [Chloroflexota bacterium]MBT7289260.1 hypothetical protein [Chloroflexota bacterium]
MVTTRVKKTLLIILACVGIIAQAMFVMACDVPAVGENQMQQFSSQTELEQTLEQMRSNKSGGWNSYDSGGIRTFGNPFVNGAVMESTDSTMGPQGAEGTAGAAGDDGSVPGTYSQTNNQVVDVDEADIVKTDGSYIYYSAGQTIYILRAYPADQAEIVSKIELDGNPYQLFVNDDRLVVFEYPSYSWYGEYDLYVEDAKHGGSFVSSQYVKVYDISDRANPELVRDISTSGNYVSSRMIGDYVYMVMNEYAYDYSREDINLPQIKVDNDVITVPATDIYYPDIIDESGYGFTTIVAINLSDDDAAPDYTSMLLGASGAVYVSTDNIYISLQKYLPTGSVTQIHRFSVIDGDVIYRAAGEVPGWLLNQFSMDEYNGYFRVVTTSNGLATGTTRTDVITEDGVTTSAPAPIDVEIDSWTTKNNLYVLDMDMDVVGKVEDLAPGERIYSARFMGGRGYMVTFRQVDPLFAIDLSDPYDPQVMGELKITGYSDYLHPYDENHLIGIGKEATEQGRFLGMKIALFDVSDISNPQQISVYEIGDRGTESPALHDHKAFLLDTERNVMIIPVSIAEVYSGNNAEWWNSQYVWQGAMVFDISPEDGIDLKGGISHYSEGLPENYYGYNGGYDVKRSLYIDDVLYTMSDGKMKMNDFDSLDYINQVALEDVDTTNNPVGIDDGIRMPLMPMID